MATANIISYGQKKAQASVLSEYRHPAAWFTMIPLAIAKIKIIPRNQQGFRGLFFVSRDLAVLFIASRREVIISCISCYFSKSISKFLLFGGQKTPIIR